MAIATIGRVLGKAGLAYLKKNKSKIKKELDSPESKQKVQEIMDKAKKGLGKKMLTGGQAKIAAKAPPPNKIDEKDFAVLRAEKAKGRGMGLQDESVQPGKVQKAVLGKIVKGVGKGVKKIFGGSRKTSTANPGNVMVSGSGRGMGSMLPELLQKAIDDGVVKPASKGRMMKAKMGVATDYKKYLKGLKKATDSVKKDKENKFIKRRMKLMGMPKLSKGSEKKLMTPEERADYVKKAKVSLKATAESLQDKLHPKKSDRLFSKHKKMGGGMMQKPMGYKSGMGPAGAGGSMAGRPGGRRPMQQGPKGGIGSLSKKRSNDDLLILVNTGDGKIKKMKRSEFEDNMSPPKQKMGGGMIASSQRPGYSKGTMVKARGCKLGRTRPTKIT